MKSSYIIYVCFLLGYGSALNPNEDCTPPGATYGVCVFVKECSSIVEILKKKAIAPDEVKLIQGSNCGNVGKRVLVCCPKSLTKVNRASLQSNLLPEPGVCGVELGDRIFGGSETLIDQFPWLALIKYHRGLQSAGFHCGGSLINQRYVITAAHCFVNKPKSWTVAGVRLGEWDLTKEMDCDDNVNLCSDPVLNLKIETVILHEDYNNILSQYNDIALIRLKSSVTYSNFVKPICVPMTTQLRTKNWAGYKMFAAGWGSTETSLQNNKKLMVSLDAVELSECRKVYSRVNISLKDSQLCAGGDQGKDTCHGDSGGPLMLQHTDGYFYLAGIVSFGPKRCGSYNVPGVYTDVASFVDWIVNKLET